MIWLVLSLGLGALAFEAQDLPGVQVGSVNPLTGQPHVNFRHADLDGNGEMDLLLPRAVLFQQEGRFTPSAAVAYPNFDTPAEMDVWGDELFLQFDDRLVILAWEEGQWSVVLDQPLNWPPPQDPATISLPDYMAAPADARQTRFLYDFNGDGAPELIAAAADGIHVYARAEEYTLAAVWDILPPLELAALPRQHIWPPQDRRLAIPLRQMACRVFVGDQRISVITRHEPGPEVCTYHIQHHRVETDAGFHTTPANETRTLPLPQYLRPCRLNADELIDYAGGDWKLSDAAILPRPIYATTASLDAGATLESRRRAGLRPHCSFIDFDGDGDHDMLTEAPDLFDGTLREAVTKFVSRAAVDHELNLYPQIDGRFADEPAVRHRVRIVLMQPPFENGPMFQRYQANELLNLTGDFNGDRYRDLAVQRNEKEIAVHLASGMSLNGRPDAVVAVPYTRTFGVADVNGDGRSDIVVRGSDATADPQAGLVTVWFAKEE